MSRQPPLWTALHFPALPLERLAPRSDPTDERPRAIVAREGTTRRVIACDGPARAAGLYPGLPLRSALGLAPGLDASEFDPVAQAEQLEQLTLWACRYSAQVTPHPPDTILIEVQGSLRLFGGLEALLERLRAGVTEQGVSVSLGTAPTPGAAALFARAGRETPVRSRERLGAALDTVALEHLALAPDVASGLARAGLRDLGAVRALPPDALARRFGAALTDRLYRLDGRLPDPQRAFEPPPTFAQASDLPLEAPDTASCAFVLQRLFGVLEGFLRARDLGVRKLALELYHHRHPPTIVTLAFLDATANITHLRRVAGERLDGTALPAPVIRLGVRATELAEVERDATPLIGGDASTPSGDLERVLDLLVGRFGHERVYTASIGDDHRPERASTQAVLEPNRRAAPATALMTWPTRPLWLLDKPRPVCQSLEVHPITERIENGWWEESGVRRDYYIGRGEDGAHYWLYCERDDPGRRLFVQGLFA